MEFHAGNLSLNTCFKQRVQYVSIYVQSTMVISCFSRLNQNKKWNTFTKNLHHFILKIISTNDSLEFRRSTSDTEVMSFSCK